MARFDVYRLKMGDRYVVDVQSAHASGQLPTRAVVPLLPVDKLGPLISDLNPVITLGGHEYAFVAQSLATLTKSELGERIGSLSDYHDELVRAVDILLTGF